MAFKLNLLHCKYVILLYILSLIIVAFGQPVTSLWLSLLAALGGYALFWKLLLDTPSAKKRFWLGTSWFSFVQLVQLSWLISHPYLYIYAVYLFFTVSLGIQFGLLSLLMTRERLSSVTQLLALAGLWTLLEWVRLFFLSGYTLNPVGLALTANSYSLQFASLWGIYGLSFWVILVNLLALRSWSFKKGMWLYLSAALLPFLYGFAQIETHAASLAKAENYSALLIQTAFPCEEALPFSSHGEKVAYVMEEWHHILTLAHQAHGKAIDLIALPEFVVPYGTTTPLYPYTAVLSIFNEVFGPKVNTLLPALETPFAEERELTPYGKSWFVTNAYWLQALANLLQAEAVAGLEDSEENQSGEIAYYSAAIHVSPQHPQIKKASIQRYEKRILMPMGEYIPFQFCRALAASYGIHGSFTPGTEAKILGNTQRLGVCICYEETCAHLMRENSQKGATILVNLTNDNWYPHSSLPERHFDHARVRTVENGLPLLRACNTGKTVAVDSLGRVVAQLDNSKEAPGALLATIPLYTYPTLYRLVGDHFIVSLSCLSLLFFWRRETSRIR